MNGSYWPVSATYVESIHILVFCTSLQAFNSDTKGLNGLLLRSFSTHNIHQLFTHMQATNLLSNEGKRSIMNYYSCVLFLNI